MPVRLDWATGWRTDRRRDGMSIRTKQLSIGVAAIAALLLASTAPAHETDQFTLPLGREFADLKDFFTQWVYDTMERAVTKTNEKIRQCLASAGSKQRLADLQS